MVAMVICRVLQYAGQQRMRVSVDHDALPCAALLAGDIEKGT